MGLRLFLFLCRSWSGVCWWFHPRSIPIGLLVSLGLRHRLLWFWVLQVVLSYGSFGGFRVEVQVVLVLGLRVA